MTRWLDPPAVDIPASFADLDLPPLLARTLLRRGLAKPASVRAFLHPDEIPPTPYPNIAPASHGGIAEAIERVNLATRRSETVCVWGDFDVDGQTSTALLVQTLRAAGARVVYYIPIRGKESHGVHVESLKPILDNGVTLMITCDTGITAHAAIDYANSRGADVIVTDHHDLGETLPNAKAIVNPKMLPGDHPLANLAGVGVAYKFAEALLASQKSNVESQELLDLVALGLIADVALLKGETRSLAQRGIQKLRETKRLGLRVMADLAGASLDTLTEETIGFTFAPRLNALGRLGDANPAVELLLTGDPPRARVLAAQIEGLNAQRRMLTSQVYASAEAKLRAEPSLAEEPVIVLSHPNWPGGVVGIVANKLVERYHKPAILFSESDDGILRGSARSVEGLHITEVIATQKEILRGFGGHPMAAGMSLEAAKLGEFRRGLGKAVEAQLGSKVREEAALQIDAWVGLEEVTLELADQLERLAPFGAGNPELTLAARAVTFKSASAIGKTKEHLRLNVEDENGATQSLLWWGGAGGELPEAGSKVDAAFTVRGSSYRGQRQVTAQFQEFRVVEEKPIEVRESRLEIRDLRLQSSLLNLQPSTLIWAEGPDRAAGVTRLELKPAGELTIYTTPPSPAELRKALEIVKPNIVFVFGKSPIEQRPDEFLTYLAGLCKYVVNQRRGKTTISELAAASAARESAVEVGLQWLAAGGQVSVAVDEDEVTLSKEAQEKNPYLQAELFVALRGILNETAAYRKFFGMAEDLKGLMK